MIKKVLIPALILIVVILAIAYVKIGPPPKHYNVRIVTPPSIIASLPVWIADKKGFFEKRNLDIDFVDLTNSKLMVEAMLAGNADVLPAVSLADLATTGDPGNIALLHVQIYSHSRMKKNPPFESILVSSGSNLSRLSDLEGKKIAVYPGMTSELAVRHFLKKNGVDDSKVNFVKLPPPEHEAAILRGDVDASHLYEPARTASLNNGKLREFSGSVYASLNEPSGIGTSAISRSFLRDHPDAAKAYLAAWNEAIIYIRTNTIESRKILAEQLGMPQDIANAATWVDATTTNETSYDVLKQTITSAKEAGIIPKNFFLEKDMVLKQ